MTNHPLQLVYRPDPSGRGRTWRLMKPTVGWAREGGNRVTFSSPEAARRWARERDRLVRRRFDTAPNRGS